MQDSGSLAVFKVTARDQGHYKGPLGHLLHTVTVLVLFGLTIFLGTETVDDHLADNEVRSNDTYTILAHVDNVFTEAVSTVSP